MISFKKFKILKENEENQSNTPSSNNKEWRKSFIKLEKGFIPPSKMVPIIEAFLKSGEIKLTNDTAKAVTMPKKTLFLVGGPVRDFLRKKTIKDYDLATNATPEQIAHILSNSGFKMADDRSGKADGAKSMNLGFTPEPVQRGDKKYWFIKGRDASPDKKPFVISAIVDGQEFEIATFRRDAKVVDGNAAVDFVDNPNDDASRRDFTINALYIELTKPDGENDKLFDPTGKGYHDVRNSIIKAVGKASERFEEDKIRILRGIRFHCMFNNSGTTMDKDIENSIPKFTHMDGVALERIKDEFIKGLMYPDVDVKKYITIYKRTGLLNKVFPGVNVEPTMSIPANFSGKKDKPLALAWLLQNNDISKIEEVLSPSRNVSGESKQTGWTLEEKRTVLFLLKLKDFDPNRIHEFLRMRQGIMLTDQQIRDWVEMFKSEHPHGKPVWSKHVHAFSQYKPSAKWDDVVKTGKDICSNCRGMGCPLCDNGRVKPEMRSSVIANMERDNFSKHLNNY